jgi:hypothetical protein
MLLWPYDKALQEAIARLEQLPIDRQEQFAQFMLHEIEQDEKWTQSTELHSDKLPSFIDGILAADRRGECEPLDPERL